MRVLSGVAASLYTAFEFRRFRCAIEFIGRRIHYDGRFNNLYHSGLSSKKSPAFLKRQSGERSHSQLAACEVLGSETAILATLTMKAECYLHALLN